MEEWGGVQLINRASNPLTLTKQGARFYATIGPAMTEIETASHELRTSKERKRLLYGVCPGLPPNGSRRGSIISGRPIQRWISNCVPPIKARIFRDFRRMSI